MATTLSGQVMLRGRTRRRGFYEKRCVYEFEGSKWEDGGWAKANVKREGMTSALNYQFVCWFIGWFAFLLVLPCLTSPSRPCISCLSYCSLIEHLISMNSRWTKMLCKAACSLRDPERRFSPQYVSAARWPRAGRAVLFYHLRSDLSLGVNDRFVPALVIPHASG